jgi:tRNA(Ile)-lysidine synthase
VPGAFHAIMHQKRLHVKKRGFAEKLERRFLNHLREQPWFRPGLKMGAGVSGGADSVALLRLLAELRPQLGIVLSAVHFNHRLRGKASDADERFVAALAEELGVTLHIGRGHVAEKAKREKANLEDAARRSRYAHFHKLSQQGIVEIVLTAHTMDDQAETVLAHILRGTGIFGLAGIRPAAGPIRRPLLAFRREELRQYLRQKRQRWREDASNRDTSRTRARMRKTLLPLLIRKFNPAAVEHLAGLAKRSLEEATLLDALCEQLVQKLVSFAPSGAQIGIRELLDPLGMSDPEALSALRPRLIQAIVARAKQRPGQLSSEHLAAVVRLARRGEPGKRLQIPGGLEVLRERQTLVFQPRR